MQTEQMPKQGQDKLAPSKLKLVNDIANILQIWAELIKMMP